MSFEPDIIVTTPDGLTLVIEAKATLPNLARTEEQLKRYMVGMQCPVGLLLTPDRMVLYKDSYSGRSPSSVQRIGEFDVKRLWHQTPPTNPLLFESFVQHWLEEFARRPHPELPEDLRSAFEEYIEPALAAGELRAAHPPELVRRRVPHVFVESTWLFAYAAPAHHQVPAAAELLKRGQQGEFMLHMPAICIGEVRGIIPLKCQPRTEANAIRKFLSWSEPAGIVARDDAAIARGVLQKFEQSVKHELDVLDDKIRSLARLACMDIFSLDDAMLQRATDLVFTGVAVKPFDHAILAGILVAASKLWNSGERGISFCETDADLQPWDKYGNAKPLLTAAYDDAHVWVYGDFTRTRPARRSGFE